MKELQFERVRLKMFDTRKGVGRETAGEAAARMRQVLVAQEKIDCVFVAAPSQNELLEHLILEGGIDWSRVNGYHMGEYVGFDIRHPDSFSGSLVKAIFSRVPFESVHLINGADDCHEETERYSRLLDRAQIDITFMGIGENGHIASNDPTVADFYDTKTVKMVEPGEICR